MRGLSRLFLWFRGRGLAWRVGRPLLFQFVEYREVIVGGIELGPECAPDTFFEGDIHFTKLIRRQPKRNDVTYTHDNVVGDDLDAIRREILSESRSVEVCINLVQCFRL